MSINRIMAANDAFQPAVLRADQQRAVRVQRFSAAFQNPFTNADGDILPDGRAARFPFIRKPLKTTAAHPGVIAVKLAQDARRQFRPGDRLTAGKAQRGRHFANLRGKVPRRLIHIKADAEDEMLDRVELRAEFGQHPGDLPAADQQVVGPLDRGTNGRGGLDGPHQRRGGDDGKLRGFDRAQLRPQQHREVKSLPGG
jgi:hypothetical protein